MKLIVFQSKKEDLTLSISKLSYVISANCFQYLTFINYQAINFSAYDASLADNYYISPDTDYEEHAHYKDLPSLLKEKQ